MPAARPSQAERRADGEGSKVDSDRDERISSPPMRELLRQQGWQLSGELDGLDAGDPEMFFFAQRTEPMNWDTGGDQAINTVRTER